MCACGLRARRPRCRPRPCALPQVALKHIADNREAIDTIVEVLCQKETMTGDEFRELLSK